MRIRRSTASPFDPATSETRPEAIRRWRSHCQSRSWPWQKPCPNQRSWGLAARIRGIPQRSREISTSPSSPVTRSSPSVFGSGRLKSCHQIPAAVAPKMALPRPVAAAPPFSRRPRSIRITPLIPGGSRPSSSSFSRWACIAIAAGPRSCSGTSSQTSARSFARERSPRSSAATSRPSRSCGARRTRRSSPPGRRSRGRGRGGAGRDRVASRRRSECHVVGERAAVLAGRDDGRALAEDQVAGEAVVIPPEAGCSRSRKKQTWSAAWPGVGSTPSPARGCASCAGSGSTPSNRAPSAWSPWEWVSSTAPIPPRASAAAANRLDVAGVGRPRIDHDRSAPSQPDRCWSPPASSAPGLGATRRSMSGREFRPL